MNESLPILQEFIQGCTHCLTNRGSLNCKDCLKLLCEKEECHKLHQEYHIEEEKRFKRLGSSYAQLAQEESQTPQEYELDLVSSESVNQFAFQPSRPIGCKNLGTTCYMNAALQILMATDILRQFFLDGRYRRQINKENIFGSNGAIAVSYGRLCQYLSDTRQRREMGLTKNFNDGHCDTFDFFREYSHVNELYCNFREQHDSQEFLSDLLDRLHEDLNQAPMENGRKQPTELVAKAGESHIDAAKRFQSLFHKRDKSIIHDLFGGKFKASVSCSSCNYSTSSFEPFCLLPLSLPQTIERQLRILVFPLPRGSPPRVIDIGLQHGAKSTDVAEKVGLYLKTKKDNIILVHREVVELDNDDERSSRVCYSILNSHSEGPEDLISRYRHTAGDIHRLPCNLLAYEDMFPNSYAYELPKSGRNDYNNKFICPGDSSSFTSPYWDFKSGNDLKYMERHENGGLYHELNASAVIVDLIKPIDKDNVVYPIVFRVPFESLLGDVKKVLIHALQIMINTWAWTKSAPSFQEGLFDSINPWLCPNQINHVEKYGSGFKAMGEEKVHSSRNNQNTIDFVTKTFEKSREHFGLNLLLNNDITSERLKHWLAPYNRELVEEYDQACAASWEQRNVDVDRFNRLLNPQKVLSSLESTQWAMEFELIKSLHITGPGVFHSTKDNSVIYDLKPNDEAYFLNLAQNNFCHLTYRGGEPESSMQIETFLRGYGYDHTPYGLGSELANGRRCYYNEDNSDWKIEDEQRKKEFQDKHRRPSDFNPSVYRLGKKILTGPGDLVSKMQTTAPVLTAFNELTNQLQSDPLLRGQIEAGLNIQTDPRRLKALPFIHLCLGDIIDGLDLQNIMEENNDNRPVLTALLNNDAIAYYQEYTTGTMIDRLKCNSMRLPFSCQFKLVCQNPRLFAFPVVRNASHVDVASMLHEHRKEEVMFGSSAWKCENCKSQIESRKHHSIWNTGAYLLVNLKRFSFMSGSGNSRKNNLPFVFPEDGIIDLSDLIEESGSNQQFEIFGSVVHMGSLSSGHYIAIIKGSEGESDERWYKIDDEIVIPVSEEDARREMESSYIIALRKVEYRAAEIAPPPDNMYNDTFVVNRRQPNQISTYLDEATSKKSPLSTESSPVQDSPPPRPPSSGDQ